jgi:opacity protein-like surface antigen
MKYKLFFPLFIILFIVMSAAGIYYHFYSRSVSKTLYPVQISEPSLPDREVVKVHKDTLALENVQPSKSPGIDSVNQDAASAELPEHVEISTMLETAKKDSSPIKSNNKKTQAGLLSTEQDHNVEKLSTNKFAQEIEKEQNKPQKSRTKDPGETSSDSSNVLISSADRSYRQMKLTAEKLKLKAARQSVGSQVRQLLRDNGYTAVGGVGNSNSKNSSTWMAANKHADETSRPEKSRVSNDKEKSTIRQPVGFRPVHRWALGLRLGALYPATHNRDMAVTPVTAAMLRYRLYENIHLSAHIGGFRLTDGKKYASRAADILSVDLKTQLFIKDNATFRFFVHAGAGISRFSVSENGSSFSSQTSASLLAGAGVEIGLHKNLAIAVTCDVRRVQGAARGGEQKRDQYISAKIGFTYYMGSGKDQGRHSENPLLAESDK